MEPNETQIAKAREIIHNAFAPYIGLDKPDLQRALESLIAAALASAAEERDAEIERLNDQITMEQDAIRCFQSQVESLTAQLASTREQMGRECAEYLCIDEDQAVSVFDFLNGSDENVEKELVALHLKLCYQCQEAVAALITQNPSARDRLIQLMPAAPVQPTNGETDLPTGCKLGEPIRHGEDFEFHPWCDTHGRLLRVCQGLRPVYATPSAGVEK